MNNQQFIDKVISLVESKEQGLSDVYLPDYFVNHVRKLTEKRQMKLLNMQFGTKHPDEDTSSWVNSFTQSTLPCL